MVWSIRSKDDEVSYIGVILSHGLNIKITDTSIKTRDALSDVIRRYQQLISNMIMLIMISVNDGWSFPTYCHSILLNSSNGSFVILTIFCVNTCNYFGKHDLMNTLPATMIKTSTKTWFNHWLDQFGCNGWPQIKNSRWTDGNLKDAIEYDLLAIFNYISGFKIFHIFFWQ